MSIATTIRPNGRAAHGKADDLPHHAPNRRYSLMRAVQDCLRHEGRLRTGLEKEVSDEIARRVGGTPGGFYMPVDAHIAQTAGRRNLTAGSPPNGGTGVGSIPVIVPDTWVDCLRPKVVLAALGAQIKSFTDGKGGLVRIPVVSSPSSPTWQPEGVAPSYSNPKVSGISLAPHSITAVAKPTRRFLEEATPDAQQHLEDELARSIAVQIDAAGVNGAGIGEVPLGLFQFASIPSASFTTPGANGSTIVYRDVVQMERVLAEGYGSSPPDARLGWLTSPAGRATLRRTPDIGTGGVLPIWKCDKGEESVLGYAAAATTLVPYAETQGTGTTLTSLIHGNFRDVIIHLFSYLDVIVNPYTQSVDTTVTITAIQDIDVAYLHDYSFVRIDGIVTT
jgi:HK97 family phage major capsid protein